MKHHFSPGLVRNTKNNERPHVNRRECQKDRRLEEGRDCPFVVSVCSIVRESTSFFRWNSVCVNCSASFSRASALEVSWPSTSNSGHPNRCHSSGTASQVRTAQLTKLQQQNFHTSENKEWRQHISLHMQHAAGSVPLKQLTEECNVSVGASSSMFSLLFPMLLLRLG